MWAVPSRGGRHEAWRRPFRADPIGPEALKALSTKCFEGFEGFVHSGIRSNLEAKNTFAEVTLHVHAMYSKDKVLSCGATVARQSIVIIISSLNDNLCTTCVRNNQLLSRNGVMLPWR